MYSMVLHAIPVQGRKGWLKSIKISYNLGASLMFLLEINSSEGQLHLKPSISVWGSGRIFFCLFFSNIQY